MYVVIVLNDNMYSSSKDANSTYNSDSSSMLNSV